MKNKINMVVDTQVARPAVVQAWCPSTGGGEVNGIWGAWSSEKAILIRVAAKFL